MQKIVPFQIRLLEEISTDIKVDAARKNITKHDWIEQAVKEKLEREQKAV